MANKGAAYNLRMFENNAQPQRAPQKKPQQMRMSPKQKAARNARRKAAEKKWAQIVMGMKIASVSILVLFMLAVNIYSKVILSESVRELSVAKNQLDQLQSEHVRLQSELDYRSAATNIDEYATKVLGMVKADSQQIVYLNYQEGDAVEIIASQKEPSIWNRIFSFFLNIVNTG